MRLLGQEMMCHPERSQRSDFIGLSTESEVWGDEGFLLSLLRPLKGV